jgi:hypothetical protein
MDWLSSENCDLLLYENNELIGIFVKSINTAQLNNKQGPLNK